LVGVLIKVLSRRCESFELLDRVSTACEEFEQGLPRAESKFEEIGDIPIRKSWSTWAGLQQGSALASVVSVCRNDLWQRVPVLLLVKGDVVALMAGDRAPCRMELLRVEESATGEHVKHGTAGAQGGQSLEPMVGAPKAVSLVFHETGIQVHAGQYIEWRPETGEQLRRKTMIAATSPALLMLCGDMRCFRLLETPLEDHLKMSLSRAVSSRRRSLLRERIRAAARRCYRSVLIVVCLAALAGGVRLVLAEGSRKSWALFLLVIPGQ
ncbi:unnamed protein product, partial [Sphacelaria rigidula]